MAVVVGERSIAPKDEMLRPKKVLQIRRMRRHYSRDVVQSIVLKEGIHQQHMCLQQGKEQGSISHRNERRIHDERLSPHVYIFALRHVALLTARHLVLLSRDHEEKGLDYWSFIASFFSSVVVSDHAIF